MGMVTYPPQPFPPSSGKTGDIAERVTELESNVSTLQTTKAPKTDIAPAFSATTNYAVGDLVYYDGVLYECTTEHTAGAWNSEHFTDTAIDEQLNAINNNVGTLVNTKAPKTDIAPAFSAETNYSVGDLVYYDGTLYECTTEHTAGAWNSEHFTATAIDDQLNAINSNLTALSIDKFIKAYKGNIDARSTVNVQLAGSRLYQYYTYRDDPMYVGFGLIDTNYNYDININPIVTNTIVSFTDADNGILTITNGSDYVVSVLLIDISISFA